MLLSLVTLKEWSEASADWAPPESLDRCVSWFSLSSAVGDTEEVRGGIGISGSVEGSAKMLDSIRFPLAVSTLPRVVAM